MKQNDLILRPSYWANVSGGKDSLYMLKLILDHPDKYPLDGVVHFELEIDYPFIRNVIEYMRTECERHGINFVTIKPRESFYDLYNKYGFPTRARRWCNSAYKLDAERQLKEFLKGRGYSVVSYIGFCADEVKRFRFDPGARSDGTKLVTQIYPLAEFGINEANILTWARTVPLFNDYYIYNRRCGCMFCPLQSMMETAYLFKYYPDKYAEFRNLVEKSEKDWALKNNRDSASVFSSNDKYNFAYREERILNKYLQKLNDIEKEYERRTI